jgi:hypothetical protein
MSAGVFRTMLDEHGLLDSDPQGRAVSELLRQFECSEAVWYAANPAGWRRVDLIRDDYENPVQTVRVHSMGGVRIDVTEVIA